MRSSLSVLSVTLSLLDSAFSSVAILKPRSWPVQGYECDNVFFSSERVQSQVKWARAAATAQMILPVPAHRKLERYNGPPFTASHLLWPVTPYEGFSNSADNPFRIVFDHKFKVLSVITKHEEKIRECKTRQELPQSDCRLDFQCGETRYSQQELVEAVQNACPRVGAIAETKFPSRYYEDNFRYATYVDQRYIFPVFKGRRYADGEDPGPDRVVMSFNCKLLGAVRWTSAGFTQCVEKRESSG